MTFQPGTPKRNRSRARSRPSSSVGAHARGTSVHVCAPSPPRSAHPDVSDASASVAMIPSAPTADAMSSDWAPLTPTTRAGVVSGRSKGEPPARRHRRHRGRRLGDDGGVVAPDRAREAGGQLQTLGGLGDGTEHRPRERAVLVLGQPGVDVVRDRHEVQAGLLGGDRLLDEGRGAVELAHQLEAVGVMAVTYPGPVAGTRRVVPSTGIEPVAYRLGGGRSIRLSYEGGTSAWSSTRPSGTEATSVTGWPQRSAGAGRCRRSGPWLPTCARRRGRGCCRGQPRRAAG
jgi:hypothetical protein